MKNYWIIILLFSVICIQACEKEYKTATVAATTLLQYQLPNVQNRQDCFDNKTTFTESFIKDKTADDFLLSLHGDLNEKVISDVIFKNIKIKFAPNAANQATSMMVNIDMRGILFTKTLKAGEEVEVSNDLIWFLLHTAYKDALTKGLSVSLDFRAYGCSDDGRRIDGYFKVTVLYDVIYLVI